MEKKDIALFIAAFISLTSIILANQIPDSNLRVDPPKTVAYVDINLYLGEWYEEALIPYFWEKGDCTEGRAIYTLESDKKTIKVDNRCVRNGKETSTIGKAVPEDQTNAKLKLQFIKSLDISGQYWIVRLAKDYSYSVVSTPDYKKLWILYRKPIMPDSIYNEIIEDLKKDGFHVEKLKRTKQ